MLAVNVRRRTGLSVAAFSLVCTAACTAPSAGREAALLTGGVPERGPNLLIAHGCVACHTVEAVPQARGQVGPRLDGIARRAFIAGRLENTPEHLIRWVQDARGLVPGTAMPSLGVPEQDARDIAAFLYRQR